MKKIQPPAEELIPLRQAIDEILLDYGRYEPLELLQREARLMYSDYEGWRSGEFGDLATVLMGDPAAIQVSLEQAAAYAAELKMQPEPVVYSGWGKDNSAAPLTIHSDQTLDKLIGTQWVAAHEQPQMDLFMDSPATSLSNGMRDALSNRNPQLARELLEKLYDVDAGYAELAQLEVLVLAQEQADYPIENPDVELEELQQRIIPAASEILKNRTPDYVTPFWRRLSAALEGKRFTAEVEQLHCSYTRMQSREWDKAREAIEREPEWQQQAILLARHIRACSQLGDEPASQLSCFRVCWVFPEIAADIMDEYPSSLIKAEWQRFSEADELQIQAFPAWMMVRFPSLCRSLPENIESLEPDNYADYRIAHQLQQQRGKALDDSQIRLREAFQEVAPELFPYFLARQPR